MWLVCCLISTLVACTAQDPQQPPATAKPAPGVGAAGAGDPYYPTDGNGGYDATSYRVEVRYNPQTRRLAGTSTMTAEATQTLQRFNLDLRTLTVGEVEVDAQPARFGHRGSELTITPAKPLAKGSTFTVRVRYGGQPSREAKSGVGQLGWLTKRSGAVYALGEPHSASFWYPVNETPRDPASFELIAHVPEGWTAVSIGRRGKTSSGDGWTTFRWKESTAIPSYLTTLAIDKFDIRQSKLSSGVPVVDAFAPGAEDKKALASRLDEVVRFLSSRFGSYPQKSAGGIYLDVDIPFALETNGRPTYAPWVSLSVIVHEYAHQWFGNSVLLTSWSDICLNECLASYAEWLWAEAEEGADLDTRYQTEVEIASADLWSSKLYDMGRGHEFDGVYDKGALAMHALRAEVGDKTFDKILTEWAAKKRHRNATWPEFERHVERVSGKDLDGFFDAWFRGTEKPAERYLYPGRLSK